MKRIIDIGLSSLGLIFLSPFFLLVAFLIKLTGKGPVFFVQTRIGLDFKPFRFYKFRSMVPDAPRIGPPVTADGDIRITKIGRYLRKTKIDEFPQLFNVLKGDMSLVGPRPESEKYVQLFRDEYREILKVKPGITDCATLEYRNEEEILQGYEDPEKGYIEEILPRKLELSKRYLDRRNLWLDLVIILKTVGRIIFP
ncbi:MAG: sugar transferase [bacterium]|nr:sugar transferase [bacterium]